ncbi:MAG: hypothetical protein HQK76_19265 [Desulfobacterales bacterium]|nr:hypothetical protein [Desulfobacterales bacterium]
MYRKFLLSFQILIAIFFLVAFNHPAIAKMQYEVESIVKSFEINILSSQPNKEYPIVIGTFLDADINKTNKFTREMEKIFVDVLVDRFRNNKNIQIYERKDLGRLEEAVFQETNEIHFIQNQWQEKLGKKASAGFIITGDVSQLTDKFQVRAKLIDIVTGRILSSSTQEIPIFNVDKKLLEGYKIYDQDQSRNTSDTKERKKLESFDGKWIGKVTGDKANMTITISGQKARLNDNSETWLISVEHKILTFKNVATPEYFTTWTMELVDRNKAKVTFSHSWINKNGEGLFERIE